MSTITYRLSQSVPLPRSVVRREIDRGTLWFAPRVPSWLVTEDLATSLMARLVRGDSVRRAMRATAAKEGIPAAALLAQVTQLLRTVEEQLFLERHVPVRMDPEFPRIESIHFTLTHRCNFRCVHCFLDAGAARGVELDLPKWQQLLDDIEGCRSRLAQVPTLVLSGGEPLLAPGCIELAQRARRSGFRTTLLTNGSLIRDGKTAGKIHSAFGSVQVSLDGTSAAVFDRVRGPGAFRKTVQGIERLLQAGCEVDLAIGVFPENRVDLEDHLVTFVRRWKGKLGLHFNPELEKLGRATALSADYFDAERTQATIDRAISQLTSDGWPLQERVVEPGIRVTNCGLGACFTVGADGTVYPCAEPRYALGRYPALSIDEILDAVGDLYRRTTVDQLTACSGCEVRYVCGGGCRVKRFSAVGSFDKPDCEPGVREAILHQLARQARGRVGRAEPAPPRG